MLVEVCKIIAESLGVTVAEAFPVYIAGGFSV
jgi:hypothetical protein